MGAVSQLLACRAGNGIASDPRVESIRKKRETLTRSRGFAHCRSRKLWRKLLRGGNRMVQCLPSERHTRRRRPICPL